MLYPAVNLKAVALFSDLQSIFGTADVPAYVIILGMIAAAALIAFAFLVHFYSRIWLQAYMSNARISFLNLVAMSLRQVRISLIVKCKIVLAQTNVEGVSTADLEAHFLAGGDLERTVQAVVAANRSGMPLDFERAAAIDLAGRDILAAVLTSASPRVIDCPDSKQSNRSALSAVSKDGVELRIKAMVTVRTNLDSLIGGATEETIVARVGQGIISVVGAAVTYNDVLCSPDEISKLLTHQALDSNTAYQIVSIDIARIDVGENIGARIRTDQAQADMRVSQSLSEGRRANAMATQQEMQALVQERNAELVLAESQVPRAIATAIQCGGMGSWGAFKLS